jgi:uroporphyrinogen-III synthase
LNDETSTGLNVEIENRIFLYSLDSQAIKRAARILGTIFPSAKIDINSDETCTPRLRAGSRNADWVVFVSGVATHQAFYCIKSGLRADAELLQVEGTGTTRIVERVILQSQTSSVLYTV